MINRMNYDGVSSSSCSLLVLFALLILTITTTTTTTRISTGGGGGFLIVVEAATTSNPGRRTRSKNLDLKSIQSYQYNEFPRRTQDEAAVLEWGHSAIISALDASVATFGPQTSQAALLEVECMPILGSPLTGIFDDDDEEEVENNDEGTTKKKKSKIRPLENADEVHGNMVVMTNAALLQDDDDEESRGSYLSPVQMAKIAKVSGAAALLVVNIDEDRPDDIYRLNVDPTIDTEEDVQEIDIPVVMISMNSANVFTSATVTPEMAPEDIVNHGMPERVRLYAGGDRPFFEDVEPFEPTLYLIHNLLTRPECDALIDQAKNLVSPVTKDDPLQFSFHTATTTATSTLDKKQPLHTGLVERVLLWQGMLITPAKKQIEERIEQVTGFPITHYSDFVIDRLQPGSTWNPHLDSFPPGMDLPMATITIFLTEDDDQDEDEDEDDQSQQQSCMLYPMCRHPVKINGRKGMAVVHHNTNHNNDHAIDPNTVHALIGSSNKPIYIARKYVLGNPDGMAKKLALPVFAAPFGGRLPDIFVTVHDWIIANIADGDYATGSTYFYKLCIFLPSAILLGIVQIIVDKIHKGWKQQQQQSSSSSSKSSQSQKQNQREDPSSSSSSSQQQQRQSKRSKKKENQLSNSIHFII